jgi:hypothetical protein
MGLLLGFMYLIGLLAFLIKIMVSTLPFLNLAFIRIRQLHTIP